MASYFSPGTRADLLKLGIYQIAGGLVGLFFLVRMLLFSEGFNEIRILFDFIIALFFSYSVLCGWMCLKYNIKALSFSYINQLLQLPAVYMAGFSYTYVAGCYLHTGFDFTQSFSLSFDAGLSTFNFYLNNGSNSIVLSINIVAFCLVYWISRQQKQVKLESDIKETDSIGGDALIPE
jgi:hypothetical protein